MSLGLRTRQCGALLGVAMLLSCAPYGKSRQDNRIGSLPEPPTAVAPPDNGVAPPQVRLLEQGPPLPVEARPQSQLDAWSRSMSNELNIPRTALQAYGYAARSLQITAPECGLGWPLLAGIGTIETAHGRYGGATLDATARPSTDIRGLPLNGSDGVKRIWDTDGGAIDGDSVFDRAVGPLQFIPSTWAKWAADADGDGVANPDDMDDAALAAGTYLCHEGGDLRRPDRFWAAMLDYNESHDYVQDVLDHADQYGRASRTLSVEW